MKKTALAVVLIAGGGGQWLFAAPPPPPPGYAWERVERFSDEFDGPTLDGAKWRDHHPSWKGRPPAKFLPSGVSVAEGCLRLRAEVLPEPDGPFTLAGAAVTSLARDAFFGYYETRMKASKISMSSTFWLHNTAEPGDPAAVTEELDIVETIGAPRPTPAWASEWHRFMNSNVHVFHRPGADPKAKKVDLARPNKAPVSPPVGDAFHTYAAWWVDANTVHFYLDDQFQFTLHPTTELSPAPFHRPMHLNFVAETYSWEAPPSREEVADPTNNTVYYDWVRSYVLVKTPAPAATPAPVPVPVQTQ